MFLVLNNNRLSDGIDFPFDMQKNGQQHKVSAQKALPRCIIAYFLKELVYYVFICFLGLVVKA